MFASFLLWFFIIVVWVCICLASILFVCMMIAITAGHFKFKKEERKTQQLKEIVEETEKLPAGKEREARMYWARSQLLIFIWK